MAEVKVKMFKQQEGDIPFLYDLDPNAPASQYDSHANDFIRHNMTVTEEHGWESDVPYDETEEDLVIEVPDLTLSLIDSIKAISDIAFGAILNGTRVIFFHNGVEIAFIDGQYPIP